MSCTFVTLRSHQTHVELQRPVYLTHNLVFACMAPWTTSLAIQGPDNCLGLSEAPLRAEARGICHSCHMDNPALQVSLD